jgi:hypothetical protein
MCHRANVDGPDHALVSYSCDNGVGYFDVALEITG